MKIYYNILHELNIPVNNFTLVVSIFIVLFILLIFIFLILLSYKKYRSKHLEAFQNKIRDQIDDILNEHINNDITFDEVIRNLRFILKDKRTTTLMLEKFNHFAESFKGQILKDLIDIFYATKLKEKAISKLKSGDNYEKAIALRVLRNMKVNEAENIIFKQSFKDNQFLRSESLVALTELKQQHMASSLSDYKNNISDWDQLLILEAMKEFGPPETKTVLAWLNSNNNDIILLGIRVVYFFNLFELLDVVANLLDHKFPKVRRVVLYTLNIHGADGYEKILMNFLEKADTDEKVQTLNILSSHPESVDSQKIMPLLHDESPLVQYTALNLLHLKNAIPEKKELNDEQQNMITAITN